MTTTLTEEQRYELAAVKRGQRTAATQLSRALHLSRFAARYSIKNSVRVRLYPAIIDECLATANKIEELLRKGTVSGDEWRDLATRAGLTSIKMDEIDAVMHDRQPTGDDNDQAQTD